MFNIFKEYRYDLETDLSKSKLIKELVQDNTFAQNLYAALCNVEWRHKDTKFWHRNKWWSCSWRYAGDIVASLRNEDECYLDWYCSGIGIYGQGGSVSEGTVTNEIEKTLALIGWTKHRG